MMGETLGTLRWDRSSFHTRFASVPLPTASTIMKLPSGYPLSAHRSFERCPTAEQARQTDVCNPRFLFSKTSTHRLARLPILNEAQTPFSSVDLSVSHGVDPLLVEPRFALFGVLFRTRIPGPNHLTFRHSPLRYRLPEELPASVCRG